MFQFPRKFPDLINALHQTELTPETKPDIKTKIKSEGGSSGGTSGGGDDQPPPWGRTGTRKQKAKRFPMEQGQMGTLCIHKSGKVTMKINGDLNYEVRLVSSRLPLSLSSPLLIHLFAVGPPCRATLIPSRDRSDRPRPIPLSPLFLRLGRRVRRSPSEGPPAR